MSAPMTHARVSPSKLQRILDCPGSFMATQEHEEKENTETQSVYAAEGQLLHLATERYIDKFKFGQGDEIKVPPDIVEPALDQAQCVAVEEAVEYLNNIIRGLDEPYIIRVEKRVYLQSYDSILSECDGTCDLIIITPTKLIVIDWKFGQGVVVYSKGNDQLYAYAAGAFADLELDAAMCIEDVEIHVAQPRLDHYDVHETTPTNLIHWVRYRVVPGLVMAYSDNPPFVAGIAQCRWCHLGATCRARYDFMNLIAADVFAIKSELVEDSEISAMLLKAPMLEAYLKDIRKYAEAKLKKGKSFPGYKMVHGRSRRYWENAEKAEEWLNNHLDYDQVYKTKLISPSQAETANRKLKKDDDFNALITKPPGAPTMVREHDARKAIEYQTVSEVFESIS